MLLIGTFVGLLLIVSFVAMLINVGAMHYILAEFEGKKMTMKGSLLRSVSSWWLIAQFVLLNLVISLFTNKNGSKPSRFNPFHAILSYLFGLAWSVATFFITPVIAQERLSLMQSIKRSAEIMKQSFGHAIGFEFGAGLLMLPGVGLMLLAVPVFFIAAIFGKTNPAIIKIFTGIGIVIVILALLLILCGVVAGIVATWIFTAAAYNHAQGKSAGPFTKHFMNEVIVRK